MRFSFIEPMLLEASPSLPEGWLYEIKLDGYRAIAGRVGGTVYLRSRNDNDFAGRYPTVAAALQSLPDDTVVDGEVVALDAKGMPSFNLLQNAGGQAVLVFYIFDLLILKGKDVMGLPLRERRKLLETKVLPLLSEPVRYSAALNAPLKELVRQVKHYGFEGLVAKNPASRYEPGKRSGAWKKMRVNKGQEFVIGGYTIGGNGFDALIFGYYDETGLRFAAKTRNGFNPISRAALVKKMAPLVIKECPFLGLPEKRAGRWGQGITAEKMKDCVWLQPVLVAQVEFVEWTPDQHLRHAAFVSLRDDKDAKAVVREP